MKNRVLTGVVNIILGLLIAIGPRTVFAVCESMGDSFMKCHWTAQAELGAGAVIVILGILLLLFRDELIRFGLQSAIILQSVLVILIPGVLIGVCGHSHMHCYALTRPALYVLGGLSIVTGVINGIYLWKREGKGAGSK